MDKFEIEQGATEYTEPAIEDYGTLQQLTASGGSLFQDVPQGTPISGPPTSAVVGSLP